MQSSPRRNLPPLSALQAFERAGARLSFRRAAGDLALSPSAVSHQIRGLEDRLGVQLFSRARGAIALTEAGRSYFESVSQTLNGLQDATRSLLERRNDFASDLRIGVTPYFSSAVMLPALKELQEDGRPWKLHLETSDREIDFEASGLDVDIRLGPGRAQGLRYFPLLEVRPLPVCTPAIAATLKTPADLAQHALIGIERQPDVWRDCLVDLGVPGLTPAHDLWVDSGLATVEAAEHGLGVALAMSPLIEQRKGFGSTLVAPFGPIETRPQTFFMICRPERAEDRVIISFRRWLVRAIHRAVPLHSRTGDDARRIA